MRGYFQEPWAAPRALSLRTFPACCVEDTSPLLPFTVILHTLLGDLGLFPPALSRDVYCKRGRALPSRRGSRRTRVGKNVARFGGVAGQRV